MDIVSDVLKLLKLESTLYFRTEFHEPWGIRVPKYENVARFHFAHRGRCWVTIEEKVIELNQGDLVIIPHGIEHIIHNPINAQVESLEKATTNYLGGNVFSYGDQSSNNDTQLVCGHWSFDTTISHPLLESLPVYIHIKHSESTHSWLEKTLEMIGRETELQQLGYQAITTKLAETIFTHAIRAHLTTNTESFLSAIKDENIYAVLKAIHSNPSANWNIEKMCVVAISSRTKFINRFTKLVGMTPLQYLTNWRIQLSCQLLTETNINILSIAERVGYQSEAAFGRVFKKHCKTGPANFRRLSKINESTN